MEKRKTWRETFDSYSAEAVRKGLEFLTTWGVDAFVLLTFTIVAIDRWKQRHSGGSTDTENTSD